MLADRSFSVMGPILWNWLPNFLQQSSVVDQFKRDLKTFIFIQEYDDM